MPAGLTLHTSNRLENLAADLAQILAQPLTSPLAPELVVVQSNGMRRWLSQQIAQRHGICYNIEFPFPERFFRDRFQAAFSETSSSDSFARGPMVWRIMKLLPQFVARPAFAPIARYLQREQPELRRYELARNIAHVFDRYTIFRPRLILDWENGAGAGWQEILWREVQQAAPGIHRAALGSKLVEALAAGAPVPERVCVFGISMLPPFYLSLLEQIATRCPVHLFVMEPTPKWWGDLRTRREKARARQPELSLEEQEPENPLLAENGKQGRDFLLALVDLNPQSEHERFDSPPADTILHGIQRDIFEQVPGSPETRGDDGSLQIHSCHSVVRELEVLHDQLLALFERDPSLTPRDIVVMAPDISVYAPFVDAIFGLPENPAHFIPYTIADRSPRSRSGVIDTFLRMLELLPGRFGASEVFAILESAEVRRRFDIPDVPTLRRWCDRCGICWGIDAEHRERLGLPGFAENSWRQGLDRMLLGCAMQTASQKLFAGILPFDEIEGSDAQLLGNLVEFVERLFARARDFALPRSLVDWQRDLTSALDDFFSDDDAAPRELNQLRAALAELGQISALSENSDPVSLSVVLLELEHLLDEAGIGAGFLSGGMTFCALKPMRSIPFKIVCLLGLNDTAYPRRERRLEFDLIAYEPKRGDRHVREDDRALFLEALLSAREVFYLSYLGQSLRDNSELPPSVLVSELLDCVSRRFGLAAPDFVIKHSLQAFSPGNFGRDDPRQFSYSVDNSVAGRTAQNQRRDPECFIDQPLVEPGAEWREVELSRLIDFFAHPARFFVENRLGIELPREREERQDREPFALNSLESYKIEQRLMNDALDGIDPRQALSAVRASGVLPPAETGALIFDDLCQSAQTFAAQIRPHVQAEKQLPLAVREQIGEFVLHGRLDQIRGDTLVRYRLAKLKAKDLLRIWIEHLARNISGGKESLLFGREEQRRFGPVEDASEILEDLLELYWRGLTEPLRFFPRSSWEYARKLAEGKNEWQASSAAWQVWRGNEHDEKGRGEQRDPYIRLAFRRAELSLGRQWKETTRHIFDPIFKASAAA